MQICTSLQTDNHASTPPLIFYRPDALPAAQPTASKHFTRGKKNPNICCISGTIHCILLFNINHIKQNDFNKMFPTATVKKYDDRLYLTRTGCADAKRLRTHSATST